MKILAVADEECKALWDYFTPDKLEGVELIIACGDLSRHYLEYLATMAPCRFCTYTATMTRATTPARRKASSAWMTTCTYTNGLRHRRAGRQLPLPHRPPGSLRGRDEKAHQSVCAARSTAMAALTYWSPTRRCTATAT